MAEDEKNEVPPFSLLATGIHFLARLGFDRGSSVWSTSEVGAILRLTALTRVGDDEEISSVSRVRGVGVVAKRVFPVADMVEVEAEAGRAGSVLFRGMVKVSRDAAR